jgi:tetratricopeptide (TPR) repeat protein/tRNA A-37 threonylcarbamoyl transferase component Bud32
MSTEPADRDLLFGVLAVQAGLIDCQQLAKGYHLWSSQRDSSLAEVMVEEGWLTAEDKQHLDHVLERAMEKRAGNAAVTVANVADQKVKDVLSSFNDPTISKVLATQSTLDRKGEQSTAAPEPEHRERYTPIRLHAKGGIGQVWLVHDRILGREVALKELRPDRAGNPAICTRFLEEARITGQLEHPGIVPIYELVRGTSARQTYYTMRFIKGRTMSEAAKDYHQRVRTGKAGPLDLHALLNVFVNACNAVACAHSRGVLHRDLKGQNILLGDFGEVIVLDWGLAKAVSEEREREIEPGETTCFGPGTVMKESSRDETLPGEILGTPGYMSPEQAEGRQDQIDQRTDVYGLGALLYEILTGRPPFGGSGIKHLLKQVASDAPMSPRQLVEGTPAPLEAICLKALAKKPEMRYASATELARDVQRWLADEPVTAHREPWTAHAGRWMRRHRALVTGVAAAALVAILVLTAATGLLTASNQREHEAKNLALQRAEEAKENLHLARQAIDEYCIKVSDDKRLQENFRALRKELLLTAVPFYQTFVARQDDNADLRAELGHAQMRLGQITQEIDEKNKAITIYQQALHLFAQLADEYPDQADYQRALAKSQSALGALYDATGNADKAQSAGQKALDLRLELAKQHPGDADYLREVADSHHNLALGHRNAGNTAKSEQAFQETLKIKTDLAKQNPENAEDQRALASTYNNLGTLYRDIGKTKEAEKAYQEAQVLRKRIVAKHPEVTQYQRELASGYHNLGIIFSETEKPVDSEKSYLDAIPIERRLVLQYPEMPSYRNLLAGTLDGLGNLYRLQFASSKMAEAKKLHEEAHELYEQLATQFPEVIIHLIDLAGCCANLGQLTNSSGDPVEALKWYAQAIDRGQAALQKENQRMDAKEVLSIAHESRGKVLSKMGKHGEALRDLDLALELDPGRDRDAIRLNRALALARAGDYQRALAEANELAQDRSKGGIAMALSGETLYDLACVYSLSCSAVNRDAKLSTSDREKLAEKSATSSVAMLAKARDAGFFKDLKKMEEVKKDSDLDSLRSRRDFLELSRRIALPGK